MIAREGHKILFGMAFVVFISGLLMIVFPTFLWNSIFIVTTTFLLFTLYFFRDPRRVRPERDNLVISAADGKIVRIQKINDDIVGESATLISIFLSVFNVHVNRMP
ncbi:MAG: phosphatidylserine decarboxylase, partial [Candidatus Marinimicrobia bacterium]|nr:phosphatidylserine decarboxylase [Candidatus Neomarinimicrobiota bacterium]